MDQDHKKVRAYMDQDHKKVRGNLVYDTVALKTSAKKLFGKKLFGKKVIKITSLPHTIHKMARDRT